jgi:ubiquinone/menaquinone biosynthesis C-methylase UbiE
MMDQVRAQAEPTTANGTAQPGRLTSVWGTRCGPILYDPFLRLAELRGMSELRRGIVARAHGRVLELGAGTGLNLRYYPADLDELTLTEPEPGMAKRLERRTARAAPPNSRVLRVPAERLPFADGSFDTLVATLVLCTVADPAAALLEARRVLRDGGQLLFIEHVQALAGSRLERWQNRLRSPWRAFAYGCRCDQDTMSLIERAGFALADRRPERWRAMPAIVQPLICGQAQAI